MRWKTPVLSLAAACLAIIVAVTVATTGGQRAHAGGTVMHVNPAVQTVAYDDGTASIDIMITNASNIAAFGFRLDYNPSILDFSSVTYGPFIYSSGRNISCQEADEDEEMGYVTLGCASTGTTPPGVSGDGRLATVKFALKAGGTTAVDFHNPLVSDVFADRGSAAGDDGAVTVSGGPEPEPTPTRAPSSAASPTPFSGEILGTPIVGEGVDGSEPGFGNSAGSGTGQGGTISTGNSDSSSSGSGSGSGSSPSGGEAGASGAPVAGDGSAQNHAPLYAGIAGLLVVLIMFVAGLGAFAGGKAIRPRDE